jgi:hypothetical protein
VWKKLLKLEDATDNQILYTSQRVSCDDFVFEPSPVTGQCILED